MGTDQSAGFSLDTLRDRLAYQPLLLGGIALVAGTALTLASNATRAPIAAAEAHDTQMTLAQVLPPGSADNDLLKDVLELPGPITGSTRKIHVARKAGAVTGAVFNVAERGYSGEIRLLMASIRPAGCWACAFSSTPKRPASATRSRSPATRGSRASTTNR